MLGAAATQDTVRLVRHGVRGLLDAVRALDESAAGALDCALEFDSRRAAAAHGPRPQRSSTTAATDDHRWRGREGVFVTTGRPPRMDCGSGVRAPSLGACSVPPAVPPA
jgi:hypothetical protein